MVKEVPRKLTRHLLICVNSFNAVPYVQASLDLIRRIHVELSYGGLKYTVLCTYGGGDERCHAHANTIFVSLAKNLSDHNSFVGLLRARDAGLLPAATRTTCVFLHDTCAVKPVTFRAKMKHLGRMDVGGWVFAHALGLYNIGVCDLDTALRHAAQWAHISRLDKDVSIALEHTRGVMTVEGMEVRGLRSLSDHTLCGVASQAESVDDVDSHSIGAIWKFGKRRHVVYLGALGVFKYSHTPTSFLLPVWVGAFAPRSEVEFDALTDNPVMKQHQLHWARALVPAAVGLLAAEDA